MDGRIRRLDLKVRAPAERMNASLRDAAEDFAVRVMRRCDALLEERAPDRELSPSGQP